MNLKLLQPFLPYISVLIIAIGLIRSIIFYLFFGIRINDFIGLQEIIIMFADDFMLMMLAGVIPFILFTFTISNKWELLDINESLKTNFLLPKWQKRIGTVFLIMVLLFSGYIILSTKSFFTRTLYIMILAIFFTRFSLLRIYSKYNYIKKKELDPIYANLISWIVITSCLMVLLAFKNAIRVYNGKYIGTVIQTTDSTFTSTIRSTYIGKTDKYVFIFNKNGGTSTVIPIGEVKKIILKMKH